MPQARRARICASSIRAYNSPGKKITLQDIARLMEKGFAAVAADMADIKRELKGDTTRLQEQVTSIEAELKHGRYETRLGNLEQKGFGGSPPLAPDISELMIVDGVDLFATLPKPL